MSAPEMPGNHWDKKRASGRLHPSVNFNLSALWTLIVVFIGAPLLGVAMYLAALRIAVLFGYDA